MGRGFWDAVAAGDGGSVFRPKVGLLSWDAGVVQGVASGSGLENFLLCEPCGVDTSGLVGSALGGVSGPCGAGGASGSGGGEPCGAGASGSGRVPWEGLASGTGVGGEVYSGDEEVADLWWRDCM